MPPTHPHRDLAQTLAERLRSQGDRTSVDDLRRRGVRSVRFVRKEHLEELILSALDSGTDEGPDFGRALDLDALVQVIGGVGLTTVGESRRIAVAVAGFLRSERERLRQEAALEEHERVERLERRLARLSRALGYAEAALRAQSGDADDGEAGEARRKAAMLSRLFEQNAAMRGGEGGCVR